MPGMFSVFRRSVPLPLVAVSCAALTALGLLNLTMRPAAAQLLPPTALVGGVNQNEWAVRWSQAYFTTPYAQNPAINPLAGPIHSAVYPDVLFLNGVPGNGSATRDITIGGGKYLFFPLINQGGDNTTPYGYAPTTFNATELVDGTAFGSDIIASYDTVTDSGLFTEIDGVAQTGLSAYRQTTIGFNAHYTSDDNLNGFFGYDASLNTGVYPSDVLTSVDGFYLMLSPLPFGKHTLHFGATVDYVDPSGNYLYTGFQDSFYNINVVPEPGVVATFAALFGGVGIGLVRARRRKA